MISAAGRLDNGSALALNDLCAAYWPPVYGFIRMKGHSREEAEDLTQEFFARILEQRGLAAADRERGKFRSFLLASVSNFLANQWDRATALKRGAGIPTLSLDFPAGEERLRRELCHGLTPEALFERQWALTLLARVLDRLREEHERKGHGALFARLRGFLTEDQERGSYESVALETRISEGSVRTAVHRLRRRYGELVREEITALVSDPNEVEGEIRYLLNAVGQS
jgi:RNA polymerase sigma-70 factor (ECF subfamily)